MSEQTLVERLRMMVNYLPANSEDRWLVADAADHIVELEAMNLAHKASVATLRQEIIAVKKEGDKT